MIPDKRTRLDNITSERLVGEVAIVDDKPEDMINLQKFLIMEGFDTMIATSSDHVFAGGGITSCLLPGTHHQHVFLVSLQLKEESPFAVMAEIQENFPDARCAFIADSFSPTEIDEIFETGVDAFFTKPISVEKLVSWATETPLREYSHLNASMNEAV